MTTLPILTIVVVAFFLITSKSFESSWSYKWAGIHPDIKDSVLAVQNYGSITSGAVGIAARTPQIYHTKRWILKNASVPELQRLKNYPNGVVQAIAYEGLIKRQPKQAYELVSEALRDSSSRLEFHSGCFGFQMSTGHYLLENVIHISSDTNLVEKDTYKIYGFSTSELSELRNRHEELLNGFY